MLHKPRSPTSALRTGKLERVASWVSSGIYTAFFTSLESCSCVKLDTIDFDVGREAKDRLLPVERSESSSREPASRGSNSGKRHAYRSEKLDDRQEMSG